MIKNVVFDVGKVLVDFNWQGFFESLNFTPEVYEKVADATVRSKLWNEFDRSKMSDEEILQKFLEGAPDCEAEVMRFWNNIGNCISCYDYTASWIQSLQEKGYGVYLLSNYPRRLYSQSIEELSYETGAGDFRSLVSKISSERNGMRISGR